MRGKLLSRTFNNAITLYDYDLAGQLIKITNPNGVIQEFEYDFAHRLVAVVDGVGNRTEYTLDLAGNTTQTKIIKSDGSITYTQISVYDELSQLIKTISGENKPRGQILK